MVHTMTPTPQEHATREEIPAAPGLDGERIVIAGMAGLYPDSYSVKDLSNILYNKINPVSEAALRFKCNHPEVVQHAGSVPDISQFDAQFFKVHYRLANSMDPMSRKILEQSYQAIYDAGVNPEELSGKKVGVYIGTCFSETEKACFYEAASRFGLGIAGCNKSMFANRISYWLNVTGPSMSIDLACCSSTAALEQAYLAISRGKCEAAIVGGAYLCMHPQSTVHYGRLLNLCQDGKTKSFDENADGCAKSEAINVLFLQKAKNALRIYADVLHVKSEFTCLLPGETGPQFGFLRDLGKTVSFIKNFYEEARIPAQAVEYVEACGCAVPEADKVELEAIEEVFCNDKQDPLLVGSVMSNIGYNEAASGITAITKVLLGYHTGQIAANMHCGNPRQDVVALREGRMRVVTEHQSFGRSYVAVNGMSVTGINSHVLLHGHYKPKDPNRYKSNIAHLVTISARHEAAVTHCISDLKANPIDHEQLRLLHNIHQANISGHMARGFVILKADKEEKTVCLSEKSEYFDGTRRPLWFVYSGMGSQWAGMGAQLMRIPIFAAAIERCRQTLEPKGIDIVHIITSPDKTIFDNILHSFVGIAAIQIGLTDVLRELGLVPEGIIGHSVGELGCAYADGCLTLEEMILSAYSRGLVSLQTPFIRGSMAAIGLGYEQISKMCPPEIEVACHNGPESSTISGPADMMKEFVAELTAKGVFAKEVPCSNIAYHSRYIADAGPALLKCLSEVIKTPRARSERWVSTSIPIARWEEPLAKYSSPEYHTNNLLNPVLFEETLKHIPTNAVLVEVAPHGLLQAILKRSLPADCRNIALTRRAHPDNTYLLLEAVGKLYMAGFHPKVHILYPKIELPVSTGTPFLSHLIKWNHTENWALALYDTASRRKGAACTYTISLYDKEHEHLKGHVIREKTVYPFASSLVAVWDTLAMTLGVPTKQLSVEFCDVHLYAQPVMNTQSQLKLRVALQRGTGCFEVFDDKIKVATGCVFAVFKPKYEKDEIQLKESQDMNLTAEDIYDMLRERDYLYSGEFRTIEAASASLNEASLLWRDNWVTFIDGLLQLNMLRQPHDGVTLPTHIRRISVDVEKHLMMKITTEKNKSLYKAEVLEEHDFVRCGGLLMENIRYRNLPAINKRNMVLQTLKSVSNFQVDQQGEWGGEYYVPVQDSGKVSSNVTLQSAQVGDLNSLEWVDAAETCGSGVPVKVHYAGLSNTDIKKAIGKITSKHYGENNYGMDFSGTTERGERVMGLVRGGAAGSVVRVQPELLWPVPAHWSLEDAATVPLAYAHAFYCLGIKYGKKLKSDVSVFIYGGAGALGQALLSIVLAHGCEVYTTVSDVRKKRFLLKLFPDLKADHIGNSRDQSFQDMILNPRKGEGCNVVISSAKGDLKKNILYCTGSFGIVFDVSQLHNQDEDFSYEMYNLTKGRSYAAIDYSTIFETPDEMKALQTMLSEGISRGYVRPLSRVLYAPHDAARAFRLLAASKHRGRVLLNMQEYSTQVKPRISCNPNHSQVVLLNEESFGLEMVDRLVARGARKLHLHSKAHTTAKFQFKLRNWQKIGVQIQMSSHNLINETDILELLMDATKLGSIQSIYTTTNDGLKIQETLFAHLDAVSRRFCPDLRYFAVINVGETMLGKPTCLSRVQNKLPAKLITLPQLKNDTKAGDAVDTVERALCGVDILLDAQRTHRQQPSLLKKLAELADINLNKNTPKTTTLKDLGIQDDKLLLVASYLRVNHNVEFSEPEVPQLTVETILKLDKTENALKDVKGLATFISYVDTDELLATSEIVCMPTIASGAVLREDEFDGSQTYLCIVPGIEGHHERFRVLCERLKLPALVLQPGLDRSTETVGETAQKYVDVLLKKTGLKNTFYLLGYETGVLVALEMAAILEDNGLTGTVYCLGCAPSEVQTVIEQNIAEYKTKEQFQNGVVKHIFKLMLGEENVDMEGALKDGDSWLQKVDACVRTLLGRVPHSAQYSRAVIEAALARIERALCYVPPPRALRSQLVLLRAASAHVTSPAQALQRHSQRPVAIHQLTAPLAHATNDMSCASVINEYLDQEILVSFKEKNICDAYLLNPTNFMLVSKGQ